MAMAQTSGASRTANLAVSSTEYQAVPDVGPVVLHHIGNPVRSPLF